MKLLKTIFWTRPAENTLSITYFREGDDYDKIVREHITRFGGVIDHIVEGEAVVPESREHRDCWVLDKTNNSIKVCPVKLSDKNSKISDGELKIQQFKEKLGFTDDDLIIFREAINEFQKPN